MNNTHQHAARIKKELVAVGVTKYGLLKAESRYLPRIVQPDEHIKAVVYGQYESSSAMIVLTDRRIFFLDKKPMVAIFDEFDQGIIQGVEFDVHTMTATVVLHTSINNYVIRYANIDCAQRFADTIERTLHTKATPKHSEVAHYARPLLSAQDEQFLMDHDIGVFSTVDRTGNVHGAVVYHMLHDGVVYILTKSATGKARNVFAHSQVSLTVYDEQNLQTLQLQGIAEIETDQTRRDLVFRHMMHPRDYKGGPQMPPVAKNAEDSFTIIRINPTAAQFRDFND